MNKTDKVLQYLQSGKSITQWEAIKKFKATRLSAIVFNLRKYGYNIQSESIYKKDTHFSRYYLEGNNYDSKR